LIPTDFSPASDKALQYAICFANQFGAQLTLLHVIEPPMSAMLAGHSAMPEFSRRKWPRQKKSSTVCSVRHGRPAYAP
jgi:nucleotide-binding universal stress UspA family protein